MNQPTLTARNHLGEVTEMIDFATICKILDAYPTPPQETLQRLKDHLARREALADFCNLDELRPWWRYRTLRELGLAN